MEKKKVKVGLIFSSLALLAVAGILFYTLSSSPEVKLAQALGKSINASTVTAESTFDMTLNFESRESNDSLYNGGFLDFDMESAVESFNELTGTSTVLVDNENDIIELSTNTEIATSIDGPTFNLSIPLNIYIDQSNDEVAMDLDPYATLLKDLINLVEGDENVTDAYIMTEEQEMYDELINLVIATVEEAIGGKKYTDTLNDENYDYGYDEEVDQFFFEQMLKFFAKEEVITESDDQITLTVNQHLFLQAYEHAINELADHDQLLTRYEEAYGDINEVIDSIDELKVAFEEIDFELEVAFEIEQELIIATDLTFTMSEDDGLELFEVEVTAHTTYLYDQALDYVFYGEDREPFTESDIEYLMSDIEYVIDDFLTSSADAYYEEAMEDYYETAFTEEELMLFEMIEDREASHEDFWMSEQEFYEWILELESVGLIEEGTAEYYRP
ncbi:hypothetical protein [Amphibacillus cookii]|uniref:hypothetical protein n=1 Tax=Amphibacillus cookii TaxID=767787 RepID=UPI001957238B|nr:hypothetical protein [Amphibacillus cookii]MBM7542137.1 hypothetical protein [Amphibacillus cookii]